MLYFLPIHPEFTRFCGPDFSINCWVEGKVISLFGAPFESTLNATNDLEFFLSRQEGQRGEKPKAIRTGFSRRHVAFSGHNFSTAGNVSFQEDFSENRHQ